MLDIEQLCRGMITCHRDIRLPLAYEAPFQNDKYETESDLSTPYPEASDPHAPRPPRGQNTRTPFRSGTPRSGSAGASSGGLDLALGECLSSCKRGHHDEHDTKHESQSAGVMG